jgi:hypothetical protein
MNGDTGRQSTREISVIDPLSRAMVWARDVLFRPFDVGKWIVLGFCAWLAMLGQGGGGPSGSSSWQDGGSRRDFERGLSHAWEWVLDHLLPILFIAGTIIVVLIVIWLLVLWLSSRGKFMFLDGVVNNRGAVVEPWRRFRAPANALFRFRVVLGLILGVIVITFLAFVGWLVWLGLETDEIAPLLIVVGVFGLLIFIVTMIAFSLVDLALNDFVVPLMYLRNEGVAAAWRELGGLLSARPGPFILYILMKIVLAIAVTAIGILSCCLTCCIVLVPYVGTVILLPVWVFLRAFPLYFLGQFGSRYGRFATLGPETEIPG